MHKRFTKITVFLKSNHDFKYKNYRVYATTVIIADVNLVVITGEKIEICRGFLYFGDFMDNLVGVSTQNKITTRIRSAWKKFRELLPILYCYGLSLKMHGYAYNIFVRSVFLCLS